MADFERAYPDSRVLYVVEVHERLVPGPLAANLHLSTPANRVQSLAREAVLRLAAWPFLAPLIKRLLNREEERL